MNKKYGFIISWAVSVFVLLLLITVPMSKLFNHLAYIMTMIIIFVVPLALIVFQAYVKFKGKEQENDIYSVIPNAGCTLMILLTFVNFIGSIEKMAIPQMLTILFVFVITELLLGYLKMEYKKMSKKQYLCIEGATYFVLVVFFVCAMIISVDFGLI